MKERVKKVLLIVLIILLILGLFILCGNKSFAVDANTKFNIYFNFANRETQGPYGRTDITDDYGNDVDGVGRLYCAWHDNRMGYGKLDSGTYKYRYWKTVSMKQKTAGLIYELNKVYRKNLDKELITGSNSKMQNIIWNSELNYGNKKGTYNYKDIEKTVKEEMKWNNKEGKVISVDNDLTSFSISNKNKSFYLYSYSSDADYGDNDTESDNGSEAEDINNGGEDGEVVDDDENTVTINDNTVGNIDFSEEEENYSRKYAIKNISLSYKYNPYNGKVKDKYSYISNISLYVRGKNSKDKASEWVEAKNTNNNNITHLSYYNHNDNKIYKYSDGNGYLPNNADKNSVTVPKVIDVIIPGEIVKKYKIEYKDYDYLDFKVVIKHIYKNEITSAGAKKDVYSGEANYYITGKGTEKWQYLLDLNAKKDGKPTPGGIEKHNTDSVVVRMDNYTEPDYNYYKYLAKSAQRYAYYKDTSLSLANNSLGYPGEPKYKEENNPVNSSLKVRHYERPWYVDINQANGDSTKKLVYGYERWDDYQNTKGEYGDIIYTCEKPEDSDKYKETGELHGIKYNNIIEKYRLEYAIETTTEIDGRNGGTYEQPESRGYTLKPNGKGKEEFYEENGLFIKKYTNQYQKINSVGNYEYLTHYVEERETNSFNYTYNDGSTDGKAYDETHSDILNPKIDKNDTKETQIKKLSELYRIPTNVDEKPLTDLSYMTTDENGGEQGYKYELYYRIMIYSTKSVKINEIKEDIKDQYLNATDMVFDGAYYNENGEIIDISDLCEDEIDTSGNKTGNVLINLDKDPNRLNYTVGLDTEKNKNGIVKAGKKITLKFKFRIKHESQTIQYSDLGTGTQDITWYQGQNIAGEKDVTDYPKLRTFKIEGNVWADQYEYNEGKITQPIDGKIGVNEPKLKGVEVILDKELRHKDGSAITKEEYDKYGYSINNEDNVGIDGLDNQQVTYTNDGGYYSFNNLPVVAISQEDFDNPDIDRDTKSALLDFRWFYKVRFRYNGQMYESTIYGGDSNAFEATENESELKNHNQEVPIALRDTVDANNDFKREIFNQRFVNVPECYNLEGLEAQNGNQMELLDEDYSMYAGTLYEINSSKYLDANMPDDQRKETINLGLIKRDFDLSLASIFESMDIQINGVKENIESKHYTLAADDSNEIYTVPFRMSDVKKIFEENPNKNLETIVHYKIKATNESLAYNGNVRTLRIWIDNRYIIDGLNPTKKNVEKGGNYYNYYEISPTEMNSIAPGSNGTFNLDLKLNRETIESIIGKDEDILKTLNIQAEIGAHSSTYTSNAYGGKYTGGENAGKFDDDSIPGNFDLASGAPFEDDTTKNSGIKLEYYQTGRKIQGTVFEDMPTDDNIKTNQRLGDGQLGDGEGPLKNDEKVTIDLLDNGEVTKYYNKATDGWEDASIESNGEYSFEGIIPSKDYQIKITYGDKDTSKIYNAEDFKSTILTYDPNYNNAETKLKETSDNEDGSAPSGADNYWYSKVNGDSIKGQSYSVLKDTQIIIDENKLNKNTAYEKERGCITNSAESEKKLYLPLTKYGEHDSRLTESEKYEVNGINLGLIEKPRSELTIKKEVTHVQILDSAKTPIIDSDYTDLFHKDVSWVKGLKNDDRYIQTIVDADLLYGAELSITYKITIQNTGEVNYATDEYYYYGNEGNEDDLVKTTATTVIDYIDNNITYNDKTAKLTANPYSNDSGKNEDYWEELKDIEGIELDSDTEKFFEDTKVKLKLKENVELKPLQGDVEYKQFDTYGTGELSKDNNNENNEKSYYLTLNKTLSSNEEFKYTNYVEITESTNDVGRRSYAIVSSNYEETEKNKGNRENQIKEGRKKSISSIDAERQDLVFDKNYSTVESLWKKGYLISIPGNIGNPLNGNTTVNYQHDSYVDLNNGGLQVTEPLGNNKSQRLIIITIIVIASGVVIAIGIILIKKKVLKRD